MAGTNASIGIVAGGGIFPIEIARSVEARGEKLHVIMIEGDADDALRAFPHTVVHWSRLTRAVKALRGAGISDVMLVGTMARPDITKARPDMALVTSLPSIIRALTAGGDDALLRGILGLFEARGFRVVGAARAAPELLIGEGALTASRPSARDDMDIARGFALIRALGRHDIGQAVVLSGGVIEAIEGAEGTDRMLARIAAQRGSDASKRRDGVLVKRPKPGQDLRVDLPAIGPGTVESAVSAGLAGIAAMSGHVLVGEKPALTGAADEAGLFVIGVSDALDAEAGPETAGGRVEALPLGAIKPKAALNRDIARGVNVMRVLDTFGTGSALVVRKKRVLAIGAGEPPGDVLARVTAKDRQRAGVALLSPRYELDDVVVRCAAGAGLEGVIVLSPADKQAAAALDLAGKLGMFVATVTGSGTSRSNT